MGQKTKALLARLCRLFCFGEKKPLKISAPTNFRHEEGFPIGGMDNDESALMAREGRTGSRRPRREMVTIPLRNVSIRLSRAPNFGGESGPATAGN
ncbi:MAG: hypothetical protein M1834_007863 [Cirrosporium novae-zelandiae]|nr:MAG: hypothetical protein M1834_007863 [Cirrosporium novae-zelandiae]